MVSPRARITDDDGNARLADAVAIFRGATHRVVRRLAGCLVSGELVPDGMSAAAAEIHAHRRLLSSYLEDERSRAIGLAVALLVSQLVPLAEPLLLKGFVDRATAGETLTVLVAIALAYIGVALVAQVLSVVVSRAGTTLAWRVTDRMRSDVAVHVLSLDHAWLSRHSPGELIERVDGDITGISEYYSQVVLQVVAAGIMLVGVLVLVTAQDWRAGLVFLVFSAVSLVAIRRTRDHAVPAATEHREASADLFGSIEERLAGLEDVRANGGGPHAMRRFHEVSAAAYRARARADWRGGEVATASYATFAAGTVLSLIVGVVLYDAGAVSIGTVFLLFQSIQLVRASLEVIADQLRSLQQAGAGATRVAELFRLSCSIPDGAVTSLPRGALGVRFDDVTFAYPTVAGAEPGPPALAHVSFAVEPGTVLGVVGRTGSGKSTIARLLLRLYDVTDGAVSLGDHDVRSLRLATLRESVGVVTQDVQLFEASLRDNLTLFADEADDAQLLSVLDELDLGAWYARLPDGLDTVIANVGSGGVGVGLSAGEAQLLAFARVFLRDPGLVILDEASSRLDPATERRIERAVDRLLQGRTGILIAHRLVTLERADAVLSLEHGRVESTVTRT
jgi:ABC-type multidrug transport system fused ATPase/permease subunit